MASTASDSRTSATSTVPADDLPTQLAMLKLNGQDKAQEQNQRPERPTLTPLQRPETPRRCTEPSPPGLSPPPSDPPPRNHSPYCKSHLRSHSATSIPSSVSMTRTRSHPGIYNHSPSHSPVRAPSPLRAPPAPRSVPRRSFEEAYPQPGLPSFMDIESIAEDSELDLTPRNGPSRDMQSSPAPPAIHSNTFPRSSGSRRRPISPLQHSQPPPSTLSAGFTNAYGSSSPSSYQGSRFNEPYPMHGPSMSSASFSASSSMPSTPSSLRSRSPSISSLDTIPDTPDAEEAATEAHHLARLKAAADAAEAAASDAKTDRKLRAAGLAIPEARNGAMSQASKDKRKRWSVCGAERRGDFEMETIWED